MKALTELDMPPSVFWVAKPLSMRSRCRPKCDDAERHPRAEACRPAGVPGTLKRGCRAGGGEVRISREGTRSFLGRDWRHGAARLPRRSRAAPGLLARGRVRPQ